MKRHSVLAGNLDTKLLLEFWPYGLKQAGANWVELIGLLEGKRKTYPASVERGTDGFRPWLGKRERGLVYKPIRIVRIVSANATGIAQD